MAGLTDPRDFRDGCGVGFVAHVAGEPSRQILEMGLEVLSKLEHRGATGADPESGDGAGLLVQLPDAFLRRHVGFELGETGRYAVGMLFLDSDSDKAAWVEAQLLSLCEQEGQQLLGWRDVPVDPRAIGPTARASMPVIRQVFLAAAGPEAQDQDAFERRLYIIRRQLERAVFDQSEFSERPYLYVCSLSSRTLVYTGMLIARQIAQFYPDLQADDFRSALCLVHSRYSTNTLGSWDLCHPFRYLAHNGEINTIQGNENRMRAREGTMRSELFGEDLAKLYPVIRRGASDSARFDNMLEFLCMTGFELPEAMLMMIPEAWENQEGMDKDLRAYYEYQGLRLEPWDGPASIAFTDGRKIGAVLDRNGLRPSRSVVTKDGFVVMASEAGVIDVPPENVAARQRLQPGKIVFIDLEAGRIVDDAEIKQRYQSRHPYRDWLKESRVHLRDLPINGPLPEHLADAERFRLQQVFGYSDEDVQMLIAPMASKGRWPIGSMGEDAALACLSDRPQMLYRYFKQRFAQVSNPAIDSINERAVMALYSPIGQEGNLLNRASCEGRMIGIQHPILTASDIVKLRQIQEPGFRCETLSCLYPVDEGGAGLQEGLDRLCEEAEERVRAGVNILILSDRAVTPAAAPIPMLMALGAVHHHLISCNQRTKVGLVCETGEAREVAHMALLIGYGAGAVYPYLAMELITELAEQGVLIPEEIDAEQAIMNYIYAVDKGVLKTFAKMGISTLQSYRGAQIYESIGLHPEVIERCFRGTSAPISGVGFEVLAKEAAMKHERAFPKRGLPLCERDPGGLYHWRPRGERHGLHPDAIALLRVALSRKSYTDYKAFSKAANLQAEQACTIRGLLDFRMDLRPTVPLEEVEPAEEIVKRFCTGAMSLGSLSKEAHETLAIAMNRVGAKSNTGEGGEEAARFSPDANGDSRRSAIKQVASGRFGVTSHYLVNADEIQIKIAQGAKPGEGGELPGYKVDDYIAKIRYSTPGVGLISPPPHHDIYSIEDLAQLIYDLKCANRRAGISVKLVSTTGVGTIAAGVSKGRADGVLISGMDGGTGASPEASIKYAGMPWEIGLAETQQCLVQNDLRGRIKVQADGGMKTGRDVVIAALLGADEFGFSTAPLVSMGCIMMRVCHLNTCPVGIATQDPVLRERFAGKPETVVQYLLWVAEEARELMAQLGFRRMQDMVGHAELLQEAKVPGHWKQQGIDLSGLLHRPDLPHAISHCETQSLAAELEASLDVELMQEAKPALERQEPVVIERQIQNTQRSIGCILGSELTRAYGPEGLPEGCITLRLRGSSGQSLGAFCPPGLTIELTGESNDYCGKGLCGATVIVRVPPETSYDPSQNVITGNVVLYGATSGKAFFQGLAGERFCVRNSGAECVVEGVGDHGCEYMTGGIAVILGKTGRNFAAGMSGGVAYVLDEDGRFEERVNPQSVDLDPMEDEDLTKLYALISEHHAVTGSQKAGFLLADWEAQSQRFVKVYPRDYKLALSQRIEAEHGNG